MLWAFDDAPESLSSPERFVLLAIADHVDDATGDAWPSIARIARRTGLSRTTVKAAVRVLSELGVIDVVDQGAPVARAETRPNLYRWHPDQLRLGLDVQTRRVGGRSRRVVVAVDTQARSVDKGGVASRPGSPADREGVASRPLTLIEPSLNNRLQVVTHLHHPSWSLRADGQRSIVRTRRPMGCARGPADVSAGWKGGSTTAWRKLRRWVLDRDGWRCQVDGCGRYADTVGHLDPLAEGHPKLAEPDRLRAECRTHNFAGGAAMTNARRRAERDDQLRGWSW